jgi:hypothetical protein
MSHAVIIVRINYYLPLRNGMYGSKAVITVKKPYRIRTTE